jgi:hypothetical protein
MKKILYFFLNIIKFIFLIVLAVLIAPFALVYSLFTVPADIIKFAKSEYQKDFRVKYSRKITNSYGYQIYSYVKANPNVEFVKLDGDNFYLQSDSAIAIFSPFNNIYYENGQTKYEVETAKDLVTCHYLSNNLNKLSEELNTQNLKLKLIADEDRFKDSKQFELAKNDDLFVLITSVDDYKTVIL